MKTDVDVIEGDFLNALVHDLRGPLGALGTWVHVMSSEQADAATRTQALAAMSRDIAAQGRILDQVSELAVLIKGETPGESAPIPIDLAAFVKTIAAATHEGPRFDIMSEEPGPTIRADPKTLRRLISLMMSTVHIRSGNILELKIGPVERGAEVVVWGDGKPRVVTVALVRALADFHGGTFEVTVSDGRTFLRLYLPSL